MLAYHLRRFTLGEVVAALWLVGSGRFGLRCRLGWLGVGGRYESSEWCSSGSGWRRWPSGVSGFTGALAPGVWLLGVDRRATVTAWRQ